MHPNDGRQNIDRLSSGFAAGPLYYLDVCEDAIRGGGKFSEVSQMLCRRYSLASISFVNNMSNCFWLKWLLDGWLY